MSTRALGRHTRPKKLGQKQTVQIFRESDVDLQPDHEVNRVGGVVPVVETGVEKAEESVSVHSFSLLFANLKWDAGLCRYPSAYNVSVNNPGGNERPLRANHSCFFFCVLTLWGLVDGLAASTFCSV